MDLGGFLLMRQELVLLAVILLLVILEIFIDNKKALVNLAIGLFGIHTLIGFLPLAEGSLFGGMFHTSQLIHLFKNVLNIGVLIILLQSAEWIKKEIVAQHKSTEFFILMLSSLLGMYYMISSGDFLMFYLGLELSALPIAALVAFETSKRVSAEAGIKFILSAALASGTSVFGVSLIYATTGSIYFNEVAELLAYSNLSLVGFIFFFSGLAFKISLVPFHFWTADVYEGGVIVLIIFSVLLVHHIELRLEVSKLSQRILAALLSLSGLAMTLYAIFTYEFNVVEKGNSIEVHDIGLGMLSYKAGGFILPFEVVSVLLVAVMIGAIIIAKGKRLEQ